MATDPDLEFEHYLAEQLSMTVGELRARMGGDEYVRWGVYYGRKAQQQQIEQQRGGQR